MDLKPNISPVEIIKRGAFCGTFIHIYYCETFILELMVNFTKIVGKSLIS